MVFAITLATILVLVLSKIGSRLHQTTILLIIFASMRVAHSLMSLLQYRSQSAKSSVFSVIGAVFLVILNLTGQMIVMIMVS